jgi:uncharacterized LabA/DUF88 family protein
MLLVDTYNLYHGAYAQYERMIDYDRLIHYLRSRDLITGESTKYAYVAQTDQSRTFCSFLRSRQFIVRTKLIREHKLDTFDVELAIDALSTDIPKNLIICSSSLNLLPLIKHVSDEGCIVNVYSCGIPFVFKDHCNCVELPMGVMRVLEGIPV